MLGQMSLERHYTVKQASRILQVAERTVWNWIEAGKLKATKVGKIVRIPASAFKELGFSVKDEGEGNE